MGKERGKGRKGKKGGKEGKGKGIQAGRFFEGGGPSGRAAAVGERARISARGESRAGRGAGVGAHLLDEELSRVDLHGRLEVRLWHLSNRCERCGGLRRRPRLHSRRRSKIQNRSARQVRRPIGCCWERGRASGRYRTMVWTARFAAGAPRVSVRCAFFVGCSPALAAKDVLCSVPAMGPDLADCLPSVVVWRLFGRRTRPRSTGVTAGVASRDKCSR